MRPDPTQKGKRWPCWLPVLYLCFLAALTVAQTPAPPSPISSPTPSPTEPPAVIVIQATPVPQPTPAGNIFQVVWETKKGEIVLGFITVVISSILVGVFLRQIARTISRWVGRALDRLPRAFADRAFFRYREYVAVLDKETREWQSLDGKPLDLNRVYVRVMVTRAPAILTRADEERGDWQVAWVRRRHEQEMEPRQALI